MRKEKTCIKKKRLFMVFLCILMVVFSTQAVAAGSKKTVKISLNKNKVTMTAGSNIVLKATVSGTNKKVSWSSSNNKIAKVKNGKVTGVKAGTCKITAKVKGKKVTCTVTVKNKKLKAPVISDWKLRYGRWMTPPADGVEYTVTWKKVAGASGYQVKVVSLVEGSWKTYYVSTKKLSFSEAGSTIQQMRAKVRAYKIVNGKKIYGAWSKLKISS